MPIGLVLDQGIPSDAATRLSHLGYCVHVGEVGISTATDEEIPGFALGKNGLVVTLDADFHTLLAVSGAAGFERDLISGSLVTIKRPKRHPGGSRLVNPDEGPRVRYVLLQDD